MDGLVIQKLPDPVPQPGSVLIDLKPFGINHAENHIREAHAAMESNQANGKMVVWI